MRRVGVFARAAAAAIDGVAALVLSGVAAAVTENQASASVVFLIFWLFYSGTEVVFAGTPGKRLLGLSIARQNGRNAERSRLLLRWSTKYYGLLPAIFDYFVPETAVAFLGRLASSMILCGLLGVFNDDRLTWHDEWSGTAVWTRRRLPTLPSPQSVVTNAP